MQIVFRIGWTLDGVEYFLSSDHRAFITPARNTDKDPYDKIDRHSTTSAAESVVAAFRGSYIVEFWET